MADPSVVGGLLLGIPMLCFYHPPELPFFNRFSSGRTEPATGSTIVRHEDGAETPPSIYGTEADTTSAGRKVGKGSS